MYWEKRLIKLSFIKHRPVSKLDIIIFLKQFSTLLSANIPIVQSYAILIACQEKNAMRKLISNLNHHIATGKTLFETFRYYPQYFDRLVQHLVHIGEQTGHLDKMLLLAAEYHEKNRAWRNKIMQALFYPCLVMAVALFITGCLLLFVMPQFAAIFQETKVTLPLFTVWIFHVSRLLQHTLKSTAMLLGIILLLLCCFQRSSVKSIMQLKKIIQILPIVKPLLAKMALAQFTRHFALTLSAGIPITRALSLIEQTALTLSLKQDLAKINQSIQTGSSLHQAMLKQTSFPALIIQMIKIGEESGMLDEMLDKSTDFLEADIHHQLTTLHLILEPLIMVVLGVLIGGLVIGMYLPLFQLGNAF